MANVNVTRDYSKFYTFLIFKGIAQH